MKNLGCRDIKQFAWGHTVVRLRSLLQSSFFSYYSYTLVSLKIYSYYLNKSCIKLKEFQRKWESPLYIEQNSLPSLLPSFLPSLSPSLLPFLPQISLEFIWCWSNIPRFLPIATNMIELWITVWNVDLINKLLVQPVCSTLCLMTLRTQSMCYIADSRTPQVFVE